MNKSDEFYSMRLYPFQDGILSILQNLKLPFYLTGGTALSRYYFQHRYSDDLDFFVNGDSNFESYCTAFYHKLISFQSAGNFIIDNQRLRRSENFMQIFLQRDEIDLKIDLVNDVAPHYGEIINDTLLGRVDSLRNIFSNKLAAVYRFEPKDIADIWIISRHYQCDFREILDEAKSKEAGVDPVSIFQILDSIPHDKFNLIKWIEKPEFQILIKDIKTISQDIFYGRTNSVAGT